MAAADTVSSNEKARAASIKDCGFGKLCYTGVPIMKEHAASTPAFHIRNVPIYGDTVLAPMDGYSDWPFRSICRALGSAMSYTEFVKVETILSRAKEPAKRLYFQE